MDLKTGNIICTFDNIVYDSAYNEYLHLAANSLEYSKFLDLYTLRTKQDINNRPINNIIPWLLLPKYKNDKNILIGALAVVATIERYKYYSADMYKSSMPTSFISKILNNAILENSSAINYFYIIVQALDQTDLKRKIDFINTAFPQNDKIKIISYVKTKDNDIYTSFKKAKVGDWKLLITDDLELVTKMAAEKLDRKEFLLPEYGYDNIPHNVRQYIRDNGGSVTYFKMDD